MNTPLVVGVVAAVATVVGSVITVWWAARTKRDETQTAKKIAVEATRSEFEQLKETERVSLLTESRAFRDEMRREMNDRAEEHKRETEKLRQETARLREDRTAEIEAMKKDILWAQTERQLLTDQLAIVQRDLRTQEVEHEAVLAEKDALIAELEQKVAALTSRVSELENGNGHAR